MRILFPNDKEVQGTKAIPATKYAVGVARIVARSVTILLIGIVLLTFVLFRFPLDLPYMLIPKLEPRPTHADTISYTEPVNPIGHMNQGDKINSPNLSNIANPKIKTEIIESLIAEASSIKTTSTERSLEKFRQAYSLLPKTHQSRDFIERLERQSFETQVALLDSFFNPPKEIL